MTTAQAKERRIWIEVDLSDVGLPAPLLTADDVATAMSHVYERFVPYADQGWEWVSQPGRPEFEGWSYQLRSGNLIVAAARLLSRRASSASSEDAGNSPAPRPRHGVSLYRTRQLTQRPWTANPGSKNWKPLSPLPGAD